MKVIFSKAVIRTLVVANGWSARQAVDGSEWSITLRARRVLRAYRVAGQSILIHPCRHAADTSAQSLRHM